MSQHKARTCTKWLPFIPKIVTTLAEGYSRKDFGADIVAGITVGIISLPLAMAFAIGSGVDPERGIFTAIIAGFLVSLLGGSRYQIAGPTGAFVVLLYGIVQKFGYEGLVAATLSAGVLMVLFGLLRCGVLIRFIPHPVIIGFSTGIATVILITQIKDFCGLNVENPSADALERIHQYAHTYGSFDWIAFTIATITLLIMVRIRKISKRIPGPVLAVALVTALCWLLNLPIHTISSKFGPIPSSLPMPALPDLSFDLIRKTFPDAIAIALLSSIEALLSCVIADSLTGTRHRSNCELVAQGIGNFCSALFGGIPATGAIARTTANVQMGAKSPISGIVHAITILLLIMLFAPFASLMPLPCLAAVLTFVAWNMLELHHVKNIFKGPRSDRLVLSITFLVTVCVDIVTAVEVGVLLAIIIFLKKMSDSTTGVIWTLLEREEADKPIEKETLPHGVEVFEIEGPFFFAVSDLLNELYQQLDTQPKAIIVRLRSVPLIDSSALHALERFSKRMQSLGIAFSVCEARPQVVKRLRHLPIPQTESFKMALCTVEA